jgi:uncharacterized membrane protein YccC
MTLTALLVLKPDFTTSFARGLLRIVGTLIGALLASGISLAVAGPRGDVAFAILFAALGFFLINVNWGIFVVTVTAYVVFLFSLLGYSEHTAIVDRVLATLYGGGLAELPMFVWPTWEGNASANSLRCYSTHCIATRCSFCVRTRIRRRSSPRRSIAHRPPPGLRV